MNDRVDPLFHRHCFLIRQRYLTIDDRYSISDENGQTILFASQPLRAVRTTIAFLGAMLGGMGVGIGAYHLVNRVTGMDFNPYAILAAFISGAIGVPLLLVLLYPLRDVILYSDAERTQPVLTIKQEQKLVVLIVRYSVIDHDGSLIGRLTRNYFTDFIRIKWLIKDANGEIVAMIREDSALLSVLRRLLGPLFGILRTNFEFFRMPTEVKIGELNRKLTILDQFVLDLSSDSSYSLDRRLAVCMAILLDVAGSAVSMLEK
jgi:uncharacterized protein YxjI